MECRYGYHDCRVTFCWLCDEQMYWIDCPTGGWWKHVDHPADDHDGVADTPKHTEEWE